MFNNQKIVRAYDRLMNNSRQRRYYGDSGFYNFGYWATGATNQRAASEALVDVLVERLPQQHGNILDVACGMGASTHRLAEQHKFRHITAINLSQAQIDAASKRAPAATVLVMDASKLEFPANTFNSIICVEAAFHFNTREAFLREALRVLKPGGGLSLSDIVARRFVGPLTGHAGMPGANQLPNIAAYESLLKSIGFAGVRIDDVTGDTLGAFRRSIKQWPAAERINGTMSFRSSLGVAAGAQFISGYFHATIRNYMLVSARKPG